MPNGFSSRRGRENVRGERDGHTGSVSMTFSGRFQEAAAPAMIFSWGARALYVGPALGLSAHRSAVGVLAVGVEHTFGVAVDPMAAEAGSRMCRTALIRPNTLHRLTDTQG